MKPRILVIDDEESIRTTFKVFLERDGYEVVVAETYEEGADFLQRGAFDVVFSDIALGRRSGVELLRLAGTNQPNSPIVMITGRPDVETAADSVRLGAFDYVCKPVQKEDLLRLAKLAWAHKRLLDEKQQAEEANEQYRRDLEAIFDSVRDGIITVNNDLTVIAANDAARSLCVDGDLIGSCVEKLDFACDRSCLKVLRETVSDGRTVRDFRVECRRHARPEQVVELTSSPLLNDDESFAGAVLVIRDLTRLTSLERQLQKHQCFNEVLGESAAMQPVFRLMDDLAATDTSALITGETGTGKELITRALHAQSNRRNGPLVVVNCSALSENLLESELFGHVRGAFTGAVKDKPGRFEAADGGTVFLDEIGDISPAIQLKLLRVLQERTVERVGDQRPISVDVRIIAATHRDLRKMVSEGRFREDLYYRLKVVEVTVPPLRDRTEDIPLLIEAFRAEYNARFGKHIAGISEEVLNLFSTYDWPGNIRELRHAIEHAYVVCHDSIIRVEHLPAEIRNREAGDSRTEVDKAERLTRVLEATGGNKAAAARRLGISRPTLYAWLEECSLEDTVKS
jgi:DNA-binding NtrC family response regulator